MAPKKEQPQANRYSELQFFGQDCACRSCPKYAIANPCSLCQEGPIDTQCPLNSKICPKDRIMFENAAIADKRAKKVNFILGGKYSPRQDWYSTQSSFY